MPGKNPRRNDAGSLESLSPMILHRQGTSEMQDRDYLIDEAEELEDEYTPMKND